MRGSVVCRRCGRVSASCACTGERAWAVKLYLGQDPQTGKERQKWIGGFPTEKQARAHLLAVAGSPAYGSGLGPFGSMRLRLSEYLKEWLQATRRSVSEREWLSRQSRSKRVAKHLGHVQLARLAPVTLQRFFSIDLASMGAATVHKIFKDLRQALDRAVKLGLITSNPALAIEAPKEPPAYQPTMFTLEEFARFVATCAQAGQKGLLFITAWASGTRQGELLGAQWRHADLERGVLWILQDLERPRGGGFRFGEVKTRHAKRPVRLPRPLVDELRAIHAGQRAARLRRGLCEAGADCRQRHCRQWHEFDLVFCQANGRPLHGHNLTMRDLKALCAHAKVPAIRFHDLRHLHNTMLMREGVNPKVVKERAGHGSVAFTLDHYSWVTPDLQQVAVDALGRVLAAATGMLPDPAVSGVPAGRQLPLAIANGQEPHGDSGAGDGI